MDSGQSFRHQSGWAIVLGIVMIGLGVVAIAAPIFSGLAAELILGWLFILGGLVQIVYAFWQNRSGGSLVLKLLIGILSVIVGVLLVANPLAGIVSLTLFVGVFFFIDGIMRVFLAFQYKPLPRWGWVLFNGILSIILGILIWSQWPFNAPWILGLLVGVGLLINGVATLVFGATSQRLE